MKLRRVTLAILAVISSTALLATAARLFADISDAGFIWSRPLGFTILGLLSGGCAIRLLWPLFGRAGTRTAPGDSGVLPAPRRTQP